MADRKMKRLFREAADVARSVPPEFREAAFNRALDMLTEKNAPGAGRGEGKPDEVEAEVVRRGVTGLSAPDFVLDRAMDALNFATTRMGMEEVSAVELADIVTERFGVPTTDKMVAAALDQADSMVHRVADGAQMMYRLARPKPEPKKGGGRKRKPADSADELPSPVEIVADLAALGFFKSARTATDAILYLERKGMEYSTQQLAPAMFRLVRDGLLTRRRNRRGRYEYWAE